MTQQAKTLLADALRLPENERADIAALLMDSLEPEADADAESAWGVEIQKRIEDLQSGRVKALPWSDALRLILEDTDDAAPA
jgi:putative addiction module component (TIGR02574 family)